MPYGVVAQLGERVVRNDEVVGSIPINSTKISLLSCHWTIRVHIWSINVHLSVKKILKHKM